MSIIKTTILSVLILTITVVTSCTTVVITTPKKDNGNHYGWYKNPNNPHHPMHNKKSTSHNHGKEKHVKGNNGKGNKK